MMLLVLSGWAIIQTVQLLLPPLLPLIISDLQISPVVAGASLTALNALYAVGQFSSGQLSDRLNRITPIVVSLFGLIGGAILIAGATSIYTFVLGVCAFGLAKAFYVIPTRALIGDLFKERQGRALGVVMIGSDLGGVIAGGAAIVAITMGNWRAPFLPLAGLLVGALVLFHLWSRNDYVIARPRIGLVGPLSRVVSDADLRRLVAAYALFWFAGLSVLAFLPTFLEATKPVSLEDASWLFGLLFLTGMVIKPLGGSLSDRVSRIWVSAGALFLSVLALTLVVVSQWLPAIAFGIVLFAGGWKLQPPVIEALLIDRSPEARVGSDLGVAKSLAFGIGSLGPTFMGYMGKAYGYDLGFAGLIGCLFVSALLLLSVSESKPSA